MRNRNLRGLVSSAFVSATLFAGLTDAKAKDFDGTAQGVLRYQSLERQSVPGIYRFQLQLRLGATYALDDSTEAEVRFSTGPENRPNLSFLNLNSSIPDQTFRADRMLLKVRDARGGAARFGRIPSPHWKTELIFDADVAFDGVSYESKAGRWRGSVVAAELAEGSHEDLSTKLYSAQLGTKGGTWRAALAYHRIGHEGDLATAYARGHVGGVDSNRRTRALDRNGDGRLDSAFQSEYQLAELYLSATLGSVTSTLDVVRNTGASNRESALLLEFQVPRIHRDVTLTVRGFRIEQDAVISDYLGETLHGTNRRGLHLALRKPLRRNADFRVWWIRSLGLDAVAGKAFPATDELRFDVIWKI